MGTLVAVIELSCFCKWLIWDSRLVTSVRICSERVRSRTARCRDGLELLEGNARFLQRLAPRGFQIVAVFRDAGDGFPRRRRTDVQGADAQLVHHHRHAAIGVIGQHRGAGRVLQQRPVEHAIAIANA